jgi:hypothetical protein
MLPYPELTDFKESKSVDPQFVGLVAMGCSKKNWRRMQVQAEVAEKAYAAPLEYRMFGKESTLARPMAARKCRGEVKLAAHYLFVGRDIESNQNDKVISGWRP